MKLVNLTKQPLRLYDAEGELVEIPPDPRHVGVVALGEHRRVKDEAGHVFSVNVRRVQDIKLMPEPEEDTLYIVPVEVAMVLQERREDIVFPAEESHVRGEEGTLHRVTHLRRVISRLPVEADNAHPSRR